MWTLLHIGNAIANIPSEEWTRGGSFPTCDSNNNAQNNMDISGIQDFVFLKLM